MEKTIKTFGRTELAQIYFPRLKIYCKDRTFQVTGTLFYTYKFTKMKDFWISFSQSENVCKKVW